MTAAAAVVPENAIGDSNLGDPDILTAAVTAGGVAADRAVGHGQVYRQVVVVTEEDAAA